MHSSLRTSHSSPTRGGGRMSMVMGAYGTFEQARERIGWADRRVPGARPHCQDGLRALGSDPADPQARTTVLAGREALCAALAADHAVTVAGGAALRMRG